MPRLYLSKWQLNQAEVRKYAAARSDQAADSALKMSQEHVTSWLDFLKKSGAGTCAIKNAEKLAFKNAFGVVSGQQIGIGFSPLLSLAKIFTIEAISKKFSDIQNQFIKPVFWLQTEDHDLAEISTINYFDSKFSEQNINLKEYILKVNGRRDERASVGGLETGDLASEVEVRIHDLLGSQDSQEFFKIFEEAYSSNNSLSEAFASFYYMLFPESEVCLFDIRQANLHELKIPILLKALKNSAKFEKILVKENENLKDLGFEPQVKIRPSSPLFFYHPEGSSASRYRFDFKGQKLSVSELDLEIAEDKIEDEINSAPEKFSCSALLRPILQDSIFNTLMYIGGPAEISYLRQIKNLYPEFNLTEPMRVLRPSMIILDDKSAGHANKLGIDSEILFEGVETLKSKVLDAKVAPEIRAAAILDRLKRDHISKISEELELANKVDATLLRPREKTLKLISDSLSRFFDKYEAALLMNNSVVSRRLERLILQAYPNGEPQERFFSAFSIGLNYGVGVFKELNEQFETMLGERIEDK